MADQKEDADSQVGFLYKTMLERDPRKRRVKPVSSHLLQLNFGGLEDSSDDSDFEVTKHKGSDDSDVGSDDENDDKESGSDDNDDDDDDDEDEDDDSDPEDDSEQASEGSPEISLGDLLAMASTQKDKKPVAVSEDTCASNSSTVQNAVGSSSVHRLRVRICCVCLGEVSEEEDEIVECDGCGVLVHEGCYGISESLSVASTESSASTEPWFCDACKAGVKPHCELCPNSAGIYKETDAGKWVHIVCALYIPGVAFGDVDRLSPVTLFEMPYSKWGARECSLCEDLRFSRTGVCIGCDAGMCRNYFHVTCAQREGLLSEASPDEEIADPFYAYCRQHQDKAIARTKRRNWLAVQSRLKQRDTSVTDEAEEERVQRKLNRHRQKYLINKAKRPPVWVPPEKVPRMLTTCPQAMRLLLRKAELLGISTQVEHAPTKDIRKKWHVAPAFSVDFVGYFLDRNIRMNHMKSKLQEHIKTRDQLKEQEEVHLRTYDRLSNEVAALKDSCSSVRTEAMHLWNMLQDISPKPLTLPTILQPKSPAKSRRPGKENPLSSPSLLHQCKVCQQTSNQHLLAKCDSCHFHIHLGCLDPPLTRMPKKTKLMGWHCSGCVSSSSEASNDKKTNPDAPRSLRENIKRPSKFMSAQLVCLKRPPQKPKANRGKKKVISPQNKMSSFGRKRKIIDFDSEDKEMPILKKERPVRVRKSGGARDLRTECCICLKEGDNNNLVRCDECQLCYHFHCLKPPVTKSPKYRGYAWLCTACDPSEMDSNDGSNGVEGTEEVNDEAINLDDDEGDDDYQYMPGFSPEMDIVEGTVADDDFIHSRSTTPSSIIEIASEDSNSK